MAAGRPASAPNARAARISGVAFAVGGAVVVIGGVVSILVGRPDAARDLAPVTGPADVVGHFGQMAPLLSAAVAAIVVVAVAALLALRRLDPAAASIELLVLGLAIELCVGGAAGRIGHATSGAVLGAAVACLMGGAAVVAGGIVAVLGRD
ncbi:MAG: hypothetical protein ABSG37_06220 [Candidatus Limnocylindrales bacterium]|jgi:hypothetical protein